MTTSRAWGSVAALTMVLAAGGCVSRSVAAPAAGGAGSATIAKEDGRTKALKREAAAQVDRMAALTQQMVDSVFSFGELGFQETETSRYLTDILRKHGFAVEQGIAGIPTAWMATWGKGKPVIALGADIDGIPQASQKPGVAYHDPIVPGGPGHGEGHNAGAPLNVTAALAVKAIMERERIPGTIKLWPGVAEEQLATKAYFVRDGYMRDVDVVLFAHVDNNFEIAWGQPANNTGLVSIEYRFTGQSTHSAGSPWRGRSALDAVELMNIGWNYRREHLRLQHRSHYVVTSGGDQPNVVPPNATVWYYFRDTDYPHIKELWDIGNVMARSAAAMTNTEVGWRVLGAAWPMHFNRALAELMHENARAVGLPTWSEADQSLARALQREMKLNPTGLAKEIPPLRPQPKEDDRRGGGSDDIGDVSWTVPTVSLRYPANIPQISAHHWSAAVAMATPIAHKGTTAGAKVQAMTILDVLLRPGAVQAARDYFVNVQTRDLKYTPLVGPQDKPAIWLNRAIMDQHRAELRRHHYDPTRHKTYLDQLGVKYPTVR